MVVRRKGLGGQRLSLRSRIRKKHSVCGAIQIPVGVSIGEQHRGVMFDES